MPFQSEKQRRYMHANLPEIANRWEGDYANGGSARVGLANGNFLDNWKQHATASEHMDLAGVGSHQKKGYNFAQNFPYLVPGGGVTQWVGPGLATAYQYAQELGRSMFDTDRKNYTLADAWKEAGKQSAANIEGMTGKGFNKDEYDQWMAEHGYGNEKKDETGIASNVLEFIFGSPAAASDLTFEERDKIIEEANATGDGSEISSNRPYEIDSSMIDTGKAKRAINYRRQQNAMQKMMNQKYGTGNLPNDFNKNYKFSAENWRNKLGNMKSNMGRGITNAWSALAGFPGAGFLMQGLRGQQLTPQQKQMNTNFMNQYKVTRDPITGRMVGGPFEGMNAPGQSAYGSATSQEMAQKWMDKYGHMDYQTEKMQAKQKDIRDIATGNTGHPSNVGTGNNMGMSQGNTGGGAQLSSGMTTGQHAAFKGRRGGIADLWPR